MKRAGTLTRRQFLVKAAGTAGLAASGVLVGRYSFAATTREVTLWHTFTEDPRNKAMTAVVEAFQKTNPGIKVVQNAVFHQDAKVVFPNAIKTSAPPDVIQLRTTSLARVSINAGFVMDLTDIYKQNGYEKRFGPVGKAGEWRGKIWSIPFMLDQFPGVWYFSDVFDKFHLRAPGTLDEFEKILAEFKSRQIPAIWIGNRDRWHAPYMVEYLVLRLGGVKTWKGLTDGSVKWTDPPVVAAFEKFADWLTKEYFFANMNAYDITDLFPIWAQDKIGMCGPCGPWAFENAKLAGRTADYFPFPTARAGETKVGIVNAEPFSISKNAPHAEEAKVLLDFLGTRQAQQIFADITNIPMANVDVDITKQPSPIQKMVSDARTVPSVLGFDWDLPEAVFSVAQPAIQNFVASPTPDTIKSITAEIQRGAAKWFAK